MVGPGYDGGPPADRGHGHPPAGDMGYPIDRDMANRSPGQSRQNGASYGSLPGRGPASPALSIGDRDRDRERDRDAESRRSDERNLSRPRNGRTASGQLRICKKCGEPLTGQFVRALDGTFHLDCFRCRVSREIWIPFVLQDQLANGTTPCDRTVVKLLPPSSSPLTAKTVRANTLFAKRIISAG